MLQLEQSWAKGLGDSWGAAGLHSCWRPEEVGSNIVEGMQQQQDR